MTRRNPFEDLNQLFDRMSQQVDTGDWHSLGGDSIAVDVADTGDAIEIRADLPGYERDEIDLTLSEGSLRIQADRETTAEEEEAEGDVRYLRRERRRQSHRRSVRLPDPVDEENSNAKYNKGVLTVTLPKLDPDDIGRQIDIE